MAVFTLCNAFVSRVCNDDNDNIGTVTHTDGSAFSRAA